MEVNGVHGYGHSSKYLLLCDHTGLKQREL